MAENPRKTKGNVEVPNTTPSRPLSSAKHTSYGYRREIVSRSSFHLAAQFCLRETEPVQVDLEIKSLENHSLEKRIKLIKLKNHKKSIGFSRKAKKLGTCDVWRRKNWSNKVLVFQLSLRTTMLRHQGSLQKMESKGQESGQKEMKRLHWSVNGSTKGRDTSKLVCRSVSQSVNQSVGQSISLSVGPAGRSVGASVSQSTFHPVAYISLEYSVWWQIGIYKSAMFQRTKHLDVDFRSHKRHKTSIHSLRMNRENLQCWVKFW